MSSQEETNADARGQAAKTGQSSGHRVPFAGRGSYSPRDVVRGEQDVRVIWDVVGTTGEVATGDMVRSQLDTVHRVLLARRPPQSRRYNYLPTPKTRSS